MSDENVVVSARHYEVSTGIPRKMLVRVETAQCIRIVIG